MIDTDVLTTPRAFVQRIPFCPIIYGLVDPLHPRAVRYVGYAMQSQRPFAHAKGARKTTKHSHLFHWIRLLQAEGREPVVLILEELSECSSRQFVGEIEKIYIKSLRDIGHRLTNVSDGGWGGTKGNNFRRGYKHTPETIQKMEASWTPERRKNNSVLSRERHLGKKLSAHTKALLSEAARGNQRAKGAVRSLETRALLRAARLGKPGTNKGWNPSEASRAVMSASAKKRVRQSHSAETRDKISRTNIATKAKNRAWERAYVVNGSLDYAAWSEAHNREIVVNQESV